MSSGSWHSAVSSGFPSGNGEDWGETESVCPPTHHPSALNNYCHLGIQDPPNPDFSYKNSQFLSVTNHISQDRLSYVVVTNKPSNVIGLAQTQMQVKRILLSGDSGSQDPFICDPATSIDGFQDCHCQEERDAKCTPAPKCCGQAMTHIISVHSPLIPWSCLSPKKTGKLRRAVGYLMTTHCPYHSK